MKRPRAPPTLVAALFLFLFICNPVTSDVDPCNRQPFRGRCPGKNGSQIRSQFVLRYYLRNGECVSYPYGHCANDENEPKLYRYKEECEDACLKQPNELLESFTDTPHGADTYATIGASSESYPELQTTPPAAALPKTECQRQRELSGSGMIKGGFIPECTENGEFKQLQCEQGHRECFCVNSDGIEVQNSRSRPGHPEPDCERIKAASPMRSNECTGDVDPGPCSSSISRWYYSESEQRCQEFIYSGCGGNGNNYATEEACRSRCVPSLSALKCHRGSEPLKSSIGTIVNCAKTDCPVGYRCSVIQHSSICCPDVEKSAAAGVLHSGTNSQICDLPKERGPCDRYELRFYYNNVTKECKYFFYGGCEGNENNFGKVEECEATCLNNGRLVEEKHEEKQLQNKIEGVTISNANPSIQIDQQPNAPSSTQQPPLVSSTTPEEQITTQRPFTRLRPTPSQPTTSPPTTVELSLNRCLHPKDEGSCGGQFVRWYWNHDVRRCDIFTYTGCNGNGNNFASHEECLSICHQEAIPAQTPEDATDACQSDIDVGDCTGSFMRYAFDRHTGECRQFQYGGCGGNGNNFATISDCRNQCKPEAIHLSTNICEHPIERGDCNGVFLRFAYDPATLECHQFTYGGCGGNGNNFASIMECRKTCVKAQCPPEPECDLSRCQKVKDSIGCPFCSCPPPPLHPPPFPSLNKPALAPAQCPPLDINLCADPCIVFSNRLGCQECVCPVLPNQPPIQPVLPSSQQPQPPQVQQSQVQQPVVSQAPPLQPSAPVAQVTQSQIPSRQPPAPTPRPPAPIPEVARSVEPAPPASPSPPSPPLPPAPASREQQPNWETNTAVQNVARGVENNEVEEPHPLPPVPTPIPAHVLNLGEKCTQPVDPGPCKAFVQRWHFNPIRGECEPFQYGGCAGNRNHFFTMRECEIHCARFAKLPETEETTTEPTTTQPPLPPTTTQVELPHQVEAERPVPFPRQEPQPQVQQQQQSTKEPHHQTVDWEIPQVQPHSPRIVPRPPAAPAQRPQPVRPQPAPEPPTIDSKPTENNALDAQATQITKQETVVAPTNNKKWTQVRIEHEHQTEMHQQQTQQHQEQSERTFNQRFETVAHGTPNKQIVEGIHNQGAQTQQRVVHPPAQIPPHDFRPEPQVTIAPEPEQSFEPVDSVTQPFETFTENGDNPEASVKLLSEIPDQHVHETIETHQNFSHSQHQQASVDTAHQSSEKTQSEVIRETSEESPIVESVEEKSLEHETTLSENEQPIKASTQPPPKTQNTQTSHVLEGTSMDGEEFVDITGGNTGISKEVPVEEIQSTEEELLTRKRPNLLAIEEAPQPIESRAQPTDIDSVERPRPEEWEVPQSGIINRPKQLIDLGMGSSSSAQAPKHESQPASHEAQQEMHVPIVTILHELPTPKTTPLPQALTVEDTTTPTREPTTVTPSTHVETEITTLKPTTTTNTTPSTTQSTEQTEAETETELQPQTTELQPQTEPTEAPTEETPAPHTREAFTILHRGSQTEPPPSQPSLAPQSSIARSNQQQNQNRDENFIIESNQSHQRFVVNGTSSSALDQSNKDEEIVGEGNKTGVEKIELRKSLNSQQFGQETATQTQPLPFNELIKQKIHPINILQPLPPVQPELTRESFSKAQNRSMEKRLEIIQPIQTNSASTQIPPLKIYPTHVNSQSQQPEPNDLHEVAIPISRQPPNNFESRLLVTSDKIRTAELAQRRQLVEEIEYRKRMEEVERAKAHQFAEMARHLGKVSTKKEDHEATLFGRVRPPPQLLAELTTELPLDEIKSDGPAPTELSDDNQTNTQQTSSEMSLKAHAIVVPSSPPRVILSGDEAFLNQNKSTLIQIGRKPVNILIESGTEQQIDTFGRENVEQKNVNQQQQIIRNETQSQVKSNFGREADPSSLGLPSQLSSLQSVIGQTSKIIEQLPTKIEGIAPFSTHDTDEESENEQEGTLDENGELHQESHSLLEKISNTNQQQQEETIANQIDSQLIKVVDQVTALPIEHPIQQSNVEFADKTELETGPIRPAVKFDPKNPPPNVHMPLLAPLPKTIEVIGSRVPSVSTSSEVDDTCFLPPDTGPCFEYMPRWFYNSETGKCETFPYGSCGGNANNFLDRQNCEAKCQFGVGMDFQVPERCTREKDEGYGGEYHPKWYFNIKNLRCEQMVYQGLGGNDNQFSSSGDCERSCKPIPAPKRSHTQVSASKQPNLVPPQPIQTRPAPVPLPTVEQPILTPPPRTPIEPTMVDNAVAHGLPVVQGQIGSLPSQPIVDKPAFGPASPGKQPDYSQGESTPAPEPAAPALHEEGDDEDLTPQTNSIEHKAREEVSTRTQDIKPGYNAEPAESKMNANGKGDLPLLGPSPPMSINYQTGEILNDKKPIAQGIVTHPIGASGDKHGTFGLNEDDDLLSSSSSDEDNPSKIPTCPNGLTAMRYSDGRPVMCLPGKNQCPENSSCYFNGMDFFCCPNAEDPYDQHIFGGYDGEEVKHGYKYAPAKLNIQKLRDSPMKRTRRQSGMLPMSFNMDSITQPLRFDSQNPIRKISVAGLISNDNLKSRRINPCVLEVSNGNCRELHLRYFYDIKVDQCRLFYWSGCDGNMNNFVTLQECEQRCKIGLVITSTIPPAPPGRCPNGQSPLGENAPVLCGNETDSIGCPIGYYCRHGPPDVCCPNEPESVLQQIISSKKSKEGVDVRRKPQAPENPLNFEPVVDTHEVDAALAHGVAIAPGYNEGSHQNVENQQSGQLQSAVGAQTELAVQATDAAVSGGTQEVLDSNAETAPQEASSGAAAASSALPETMCPDGSDALLDKATGKPKICGTGFDGHEFCPKRYYCSIEPERNARLCCPLLMISQKIPTPQQGMPPYFGHRSQNPGEVIERGSLPSDPKPKKMPLPKTTKTKLSKEVEDQAVEGSSLSVGSEQLQTGPQEAGPSAFASGPQSAVGSRAAPAAVQSQQNQVNAAQQTQESYRAQAKSFAFKTHVNPEESNKMGTLETLLGGKPESFFAPNTEQLATEQQQSDTISTTTQAIEPDPSSTSATNSTVQENPLLEDINGETFANAEGQAPSMNPADWLANLRPDEIKTIETPTPLGMAETVGNVNIQPPAMPFSEQVQPAPQTEEQNEGPEFGHMYLKELEPPSRLSKSMKEPIRLSNKPQDKTDDSNIFVSSAEDPFDGENVRVPKKKTIDKSICYLQPTEGRPCRPDEKMPMTNLHFYYSTKEKRCKLFFNHGCGGNDNRFESKAECEKICS